MRFARVTTVFGLVVYINVDMITHISFDTCSDYAFGKIALITCYRGTVEISITEYNERIAPLIGGQHED